MTRRRSCWRRSRGPSRSPRRRTPASSAGAATPTTRRRWSCRRAPTPPTASKVLHGTLQHQRLGRFQPRLRLRPEPPATGPRTRASGSGGTARTPRRCRPAPASGSTSRSRTAAPTARRPSCGTRSFTDDWQGWHLVEIPFSELRLPRRLPAGRRHRPGPRASTEMWGYALTLPAGAPGEFADRRRRGVRQGRPGAEGERRHRRRRLPGQGGRHRPGRRSPSPPPAAARSTSRSPSPTRTGGGTAGAARLHPGHRHAHLPGRHGVRHAPSTVDGGHPQGPDRRGRRDDPAQAHRHRREGARGPSRSS